MKSSLMFDFKVDRKSNQIDVVREFAAPVSSVWAAWTQEELLDQWWAPKPWKTETSSMDFRNGGTWLYSMVGPEGERHYSRADYQSISPEESFSAIDAFCDEQGNITKEFPGSKWTVKFSGSGDTTTVKIRIRHESLEDLEKIIAMGFKEGFTMALENLDELLLQKKD